MIITPPAFHGMFLIPHDIIVPHDTPTHTICHSKGTHRRARTFTPQYLLLNPHRQDTDTFDFGNFNLFHVRAHGYWVLKYATKLNALNLPCKLFLYFFSYPANFFQRTSRCVPLCHLPAVDGARLGREVDAETDDLLAGGEERFVVAFLFDLL